MTIHVYDVIGETGITVDDGDKLYQVIITELNAGKIVDLDFERVRLLASPFLNAAIGRLLKDFKPEDLNTLLHIKHLPASAHAIWRRVIENAKAYFSDDKTREMLNTLLTSDDTPDET